MKLDGLGVTRTLYMGALAVGLLAVVSSCNDHPVVGFKTLVKVQQCDEVAVPGRPKIDMLWVVDNSGSLANFEKNWIVFSITFLVHHTWSLQQVWQQFCQSPSFHNNGQSNVIGTQHFHIAVRLQRIVLWIFLVKSVCVLD